MNTDFSDKFKIQHNVSLADYTSIKIGGNAKYLASISDLNLYIELYLFCKEKNIRFLSLGHGTNVFFPQTGFDGLVVINKMDKICTCSGNSILAQSGASLADVNKTCLENSLTGFEFTSGIPGSVGGAVFGNAGAYGCAIGNRLIRAKILTPEGKISFVDNDFFKFSYRSSYLKVYNAILLEAEFQFQKGDQQIIENKINEILELRRQKLPDHNVPTAGSYFKNLKDQKGNPIAAAKYLDAVNSKQTSVGDIGVHFKHANIFYNKGKGTADQVLELEKILKDKVLKKFGIDLEREVMFLE